MSLFIRKTIMPWMAMFLMGVCFGVNLSHFQGLHTDSVMKKENKNNDKNHIQVQPRYQSTTTSPSSSSRTSRIRDNGTTTTTTTSTIPNEYERNNDHAKQNQDKQRQRQRQRLPLLEDSSSRRNEREPAVVVRQQENIADSPLEQCRSALLELKVQLKDCQHAATECKASSKSSSSSSSSWNNKSMASEADDETASDYELPTMEVKHDSRSRGRKKASMVQSPVCRHLFFQHPIPTAMSLWSSHLGRIHKASQLPNDEQYFFHDFTAELLHLVSNRLPRAIKTVPHRWDSVRHVLDVGYQRWTYLNNLAQKKNRGGGRRQRRNKQHHIVEAPRKLKIHIMGGSLLVGTNCRKNVADLNLTTLRQRRKLSMPNRYCTWSNRLEKFLNQLLLGPFSGQLEKDTAATAAAASQDSTSIWDLVHVTRTAMGGTNTETGQTILEYDLLPEEARQPDIIINAYSTNDMHVYTMKDAANSNITLREKAFDIIQGFVRHVLQMRAAPLNCDQVKHADQPSATSNNSTYSKPLGQDVLSSPPPPPPLFLHMDDYLGNEQREILATTELSQGVQVLANYYGFTSMSYADVVRDLVYGDTRESWFSPSGWYEYEGHPSEKMQREIHPDMGMHITATWVTAFTMLHLATTFCSLEWSLVESKDNNSNMLASLRNDTQTLKYESLLTLPNLTGLYPVPGKPRRPPEGDVLPPPLTKDLLLDDITALWRGQSRSSDDTTLSTSSSCDPKRSIVQCPFSWVSSLNQHQKSIAYVQEYFAKQIVSNNGWEISSDHNKLGYVPVRGQNSSMELEFRNLTQPIGRLTLLVLKSYGPLWAKSRLKVIASQNDDHQTSSGPVLQAVLEGFHQKQTSETYTHKLRLNRTAAVGSTLRLRIELVDGETFKLMGLAVCS